MEVGGSATPRFGGIFGLVCCGGCDGVCIGAGGGGRVAVDDIVDVLMLIYSMAAECVLE